jgi:epoxyqueuosine reductase
LDACPTQAFPQPYELDARRCISYLTIELHDAIPVELREGMGDWVFGCDICQEVCPWNRHAPPTTEVGFQPLAELNPIALPELFDLDETAFRRRFRQTPLWRAHRRGLLRSAAIVLGNRADPAALPALEKAVQDEDPVVRGAAAWALGQFRTSAAAQLLRARQEVEADADVQNELQAAVARS